MILVIGNTSPAQRLSIRRSLRNDVPAPGLQNRLRSPRHVPPPIPRKRCGDAGRHRYAMIYGIWSDRIREGCPVSVDFPGGKDRSFATPGNLLCRILRLRGYTRCRGVRSYRPFPGDNIQYTSHQCSEGQISFSAVHNSFYYKVWEASRCVTAHNSSISSQRPEPFIWRLSGEGTVWNGRYCSSGSSTPCYSVWYPVSVTPAGVTPLLYDTVPGLVAFCPFTLVDHVPEKIDAFRGYSCAWQSVLPPPPRQTGGNSA